LGGKEGNGGGRWVDRFEKRSRKVSGGGSIEYGTSVRRRNTDQQKIMGSGKPAIQKSKSRGFGLQKKTSGSINLKR